MRPTAALLVAFGAFLAATPLLAQDAQRFRAELDATRALIDAKQWSSALDKLRLLLQANEKRPWAFEARSELVRLDRLCRFRMQVQEPTDQQLIEGRILRLNKKKNTIKLRYTSAQLRDFLDPNAPKKKRTPRKRTFGKGKLEELRRDVDKAQRAFEEAMKRSRTRGPTHASRLLVHPAVFRDVKITIRGKAYGFARLVLANTPEGRYDCIVGTPPQTGGVVYYPTRVTLMRGGKSEQVLLEHWGALRKPTVRKGKTKKSKKPKKAPPLKFPMRHGERFTILARVGKTISVRYNGKTVASFSNKLATRGRFGFDVSGFDTIEIDGRFDPAWLQNKRDAAVQAQRLRFDRLYDARKSLPAWLFRADPSVAARPKKKRERKQYPGKLAIEDVPPFNKLIASLNARNYRTLLLRIAVLPKGRISAPIRHWLRAHAHHGLGSSKGCLENAKKLIAEDPDFFEGYLLAAMAHARLNQVADALEALRQAAKLDPANAQIYELGAQMSLRNGRGKEASAWLEDARRAGTRLPKQRALEASVRKLLHGPEWTRRFKVEDALYTVESDIDRKICKDAATVLERSRRFYERDLGWKVGEADESAKSAPFRVYIFSGKTGFENYRKSFGSAPIHNPAGLFDPTLRQLLIWNLPSRTELLRTVRHEGFHQFLDHALPNAPTWLNEGLAEYYERSRTELGPPQLGAVHPAHLRTLSRPGAIPKVGAFLRVSRKQFYASALVNYARGWALVHFLRRGPKRWRPIFARFVDAIREGNSQDEAAGIALRGNSEAALRDAWTQHLEGLRSKK